jgi:hypothetical protein
MNVFVWEWIMKEIFERLFIGQDSEYFKEREG